MEDNGELIQGIDKDRFYRISLILIVSTLVVGSINQGIFSGEFPISDIIGYFVIIMFFYILIVYMMIQIGGEPSKFEIFFIPTIIITFVGFALYLLNLIPDIENPPPENGDTTSSTVTTVTSPTTGTSTNGGPTPTSNPEVDSEVQNLINFSQIALMIILLLVIIGIVIYVYKNRSRFEPELHLAHEIEYSKPRFQSNKDIIQYYTTASESIERVKGNAPQWFSPTYFAEHVDYSPGPPLSSYFDRLTVLYEWARFSNQEMTSEDVIEAKELVFDIHNQLELIIQQIKEQESS